VLLADVVATSAAVAATRSRTAKAAAIADLLRRAEGDEVPPVTAWLAGDSMQGRLGSAGAPSPGSPPTRPARRD
jgi:DNA ligase-1